MEGNLIYKYVDTNMFCVVTSNEKNDLFYYVINSVTGKVIHKFHEINVKLDAPISIELYEHYLILTFQRLTANGVSS